MLSALRAIAGNDDVKDAVVNAGGTELIVLAINRHLSNAQVILFLLSSEKRCLCLGIKLQLWRLGD